MSFGFSPSDILRAIELVKDLRSRFVDAPLQYKAIGEELRGLFIVLEDVDAVLPHRSLTDKQRDHLQHLLKTCWHVAQSLDAKLSRYQDIDPDSGTVPNSGLASSVKRAWKRVRWEPNDISEARSRITSTVLLLRQFHAHIFSQHTTQAHRLIGDGLAAIKDLQLDQKAAHEKEAILEWLTPVEYYHQQNEYYKQRREGTGEWLITSSGFQGWMNGRKGTLFCTGIPGAGKTSFTSLVIRHLEESLGHDPGVAITYVYVNYHRREEQEPVELFASLVKQLLQHQATIPDAVGALYDRHQPRRSRPTLAELINVYTLVARSYSQIFIMIDALDEYDDVYGSRRLFLSSIFKLQLSTSANLFVTSRHIPDIQTAFEHHGSTRLEVRGTDEDISQYIAGRLPQLPSFVMSNETLKSEVVAQIKSAVDGMFLLAKLHLDSLIGKRSPKALRAVLQTLPRGSSASYSRAYDVVMDRINDQSSDARELAHQALSWVVCSQRPLSSLELQHALSLESGDRELDEEKFSTMDDILSVCAGLLVLSQSEGTVTLVHYTAQEYFEHDLESWMNTAHATLSTGCITYLSFDDFSSGACEDLEEFQVRLTRFELFDYCAHHWGHHVAKVLSAVKPILTNLLNKSGNRASCWQAMQMQASQWQGTWQIDWQISAVHLLATFELAVLLPDLISLNAPTDSRDSKGRTPLSYAALYGNNTLASALLEHGVDVNSKDNQGRTPLFLAAANGHDAVAQALLRKGADIESHDHGGHTPLVSAVQNGHYKVVCLLLDENATTHSQDRQGRTPISYAAWHGHEDVLSILMREGVPPDIEDGDGRTILSYAASSGNDSLVAALLDRGADVDSRDQSSRTPLFFAAWNAHESVCLLLLSRGADAAHHDTNNRVPLSFAAMGGDAAIVTLLLEQPGVANQANNRDRSGRTVLSYAASNGDVAAMKCLLDRNGVDPASADITGRTPLFYAAYSGNTDAVELLLSMATVNPLSVSNLGRSPLSIAEKARYFGIHSLLIDECIRRGLDVDRIARLDQGQFPTIHMRYAGCDSCMSWIMSFDIEYHCALCNGQGFDICLECIANNASCLDASHTLVKRRFCMGIGVEPLD